MKYSALYLPDVQTSTVQEAAEHFAQATAEREFSTLYGWAWDVQFDGAPDNLHTRFEFTATIGMKFARKEKGRKISFVIWVTGTHQLIDGRVVQTAPLAEALRAQKRAALTGDPGKQPIPGTLYGYARLFAFFGKVKCVGMIPDKHRDLYARHFAGLLENRPQGFLLSEKNEAFLALVPEYMGDQVSETVIRLASLTEYTGGKLTSDRTKLPAVD